MQEYADPVIDWLDAGRGILARRLFRDVSSVFFPLLILLIQAPASHVLSCRTDLIPRIYPSSSKTSLESASWITLPSAIVSMKVGEDGALLHCRRNDDGTHSERYSHRGLDP